VRLGRHFTGLLCCGMQDTRPPAARPEQLTLIWESELVARGDGRMELVARKPLSEMSVKRTARVLGVS